MESDLILRWLEPLGQQKTSWWHSWYPVSLCLNIRSSISLHFGTLVLGHSVASCKLLCHYVVQYHIWTCECINQRWWWHCIPCCRSVTEVPIQSFKGCTRRFQCHCPARLVRPNCQQRTMDAQGIMLKLIKVKVVMFQQKIHRTVGDLLGGSLQLSNFPGFFPSPSRSEVMFTVGCRIIWSWKMLSFWGGLQFSTNLSTGSRVVFLVDATQETSPIFFAKSQLSDA